MSNQDWFYATKPTRLTVFLRTFLPYQAWRFLWLNFKMLGIIRRSHGGTHETERPGAKS
jgi:hypothetical protein